MRKHKKVIARVIAILLFITGAIVIGSSIILWHYIGTEGDPVKLIPSLIELETGKEMIELVDANSVKYITKASNHTIIKHYLSLHGWRYGDQMGSSFLFMKDKELIYVSFRPYLHCRYTVYRTEKPIVRN